jgi:hypothetical protein
MPLSRRFTPEHAPGDRCTFGLDFSYLIPPGVGIASGSLAIYTNTVAPVLSSDFTIGPVLITGRIIYSQLQGGVDGTDYQLRFNVIDTQGNDWTRTALVLCSETS